MKVKGERERSRYPERQTDTKCKYRWETSAADPRRVVSLKIKIPDYVEYTHTARV